jgi:hypothetical protein
MIRKIVLGIFLLVIILFLMPWVNVSCAGASIVEVSGFDMVTGNYNVPQEYAGSSSGSNNEPLAIGVLAAAVAGAIFSLFSGKFGIFMRVLSGLAGIALLIALKIKLGNDFRDSSADTSNEMYGVVQLRFLIGYWLTLGAFAVAAILSVIKKDVTIKISTKPETATIGITPENKPPPV